MRNTEFVYLCPRCGEVEVFTARLHRPGCPCGGKMLLWDEVPKQDLVGSYAQRREEICLYEERND